jgi:hypothetical protein
MCSVCRSCCGGCTAPALDPISPASFCGTPAAQTVNLTGIAGSNTPLVVTSTSSNTAMIPNPTVTYTSPNATGTIVYTPAAAHYGSAMISVKVTASAACGGVTSIVRTFGVSVTQVFGPPTLDQPFSPTNAVSWPHASGAQTVNLTGIGAGVGSATPISVFATSSNPGLVANPTVFYTSPNTTGSLGFSITTGSTGTATITVTVDNSAPGGACVTNTFSRTFVVTIT